MLELDRSVRSADAVHQRAAVARLYVRASGDIGLEHVEVIRHDRIEFVVLPDLADLRLVRHGDVLCS